MNVELGTVFQVVFIGCMVVITIAIGHMAGYW